MATMADILLGKPNALPYDVQTEQTDLGRRRQLMMALQRAAMGEEAPTVAAGSNRVVPNWAGPLTKIANAYFAGKEEERLKADEAKVATENAQKLAKGLERYATTMAGQPAIEQPPEELGGGPGRPAVKGDPYAAATQAALSGIPHLQEFGAERLKALEAGRLTPKAIFEHGAAAGADLPSIVAASQSGDVSGLQEKPGHIVAGDQIYTTRGGKVDPNVPPVDARKQWGPVAPVPGTTNIYAATEKTTGEPKFAPGGTNISIDTKAETAFGQAVGKERAEKLAADANNLQSRMNELPNYAMVDQLIDSAQTGFGADQILIARRVGKALGLSDDAVGKIKDSQTLYSILGGHVLEDVKKLGSGAGISNADRDYAAKINAADLGQDPQTMKNIVRIRMARLMNDAASHQKNIKAVQEAFPDQASRAAVYNVETDFGDMPERFGLTQDPTGKWSAMRAVTGQTPGMPAPAPAPVPGAGQPKRKIKFGEM